MALQADVLPGVAASCPQVGGQQLLPSCASCASLPEPMWTEPSRQVVKTFQSFSTQSRRARRWRAGQASCPDLAACVDDRADQKQEARADVDGEDASQAWPPRRCDN